MKPDAVGANGAEELSPGRSTHILSTYLKIRISLGTFQSAYEGGTESNAKRIDHRVRIPT